MWSTVNSKRRDDAVQKEETKENEEYELRLNYKSAITALSLSNELHDAKWSEAKHTLQCLDMSLSEKSTDHNRVKDVHLYFLVKKNLSVIHEKEGNNIAAMYDALDAVQCGVETEDSALLARIASLAIKVGDLWTCQALLNCGHLSNSFDCIVEALRHKCCEGLRKQALVCDMEEWVDSVDILHVSDSKSGLNVKSILQGLTRLFDAWTESGPPSYITLVSTSSAVVANADCAEVPSFVDIVHPICFRDGETVVSDDNGQGFYNVDATEDDTGEVADSAVPKTLRRRSARQESRKQRNGEMDYSAIVVTTDLGLPSGAGLRECDEQLWERIRNQMEGYFSHILTGKEAQKQGSRDPLGFYISCLVDVDDVHQVPLPLDVVSNLWRDIVREQANSIFGRDCRLRFSSHDHADSSCSERTIDRDDEKIIQAMEVMSPGAWHDLSALLFMEEVTERRVLLVHLCTALLSGLSGAVAESTNTTSLLGDIADHRGNLLSEGVLVCWVVILRTHGGKLNWVLTQMSECEQLLVAECCLNALMRSANDDLKHKEYYTQTMTALLGIWENRGYLLFNNQASGEIKVAAQARRLWVVLHYVREFSFNGSFAASSCIQQVVDNLAVSLGERVVTLPHLPPLTGFDQPGLSGIISADAAQDAISEADFGVRMWAQRYLALDVSDSDAICNWMKGLWVYLQHRDDSEHSTPRCDIFQCKLIPPETATAMLQYISSDMNLSDIFQKHIDDISRSQYAFSLLVLHACFRLGDADVLARICGVLLLEASESCYKVFEKKIDEKKMKWLLLNCDVIYAVLHVLSSVCALENGGACTRVDMDRINGELSLFLESVIMEGMMLVFSAYQICLQYGLGYRDVLQTYCVCAAHSVSTVIITTDIFKGKISPLLLSLISCAELEIGITLSYSVGAESILDRCPATLKCMVHISRWSTKADEGVDVRCIALLMYYSLYLMRYLDGDGITVLSSHSAINVDGSSPRVRGRGGAEWEPMWASAAADGETTDVVAVTFGACQLMMHSVQNGIVLFTDDEFLPIDVSFSVMKLVYGTISSHGLFYIDGGTLSILTLDVLSPLIVSAYGVNSANRPPPQVLSNPNCVLCGVSIRDLSESSLSSLMQIIGQALFDVFCFPLCVWYCKNKKESLNFSVGMDNLNFLFAFTKFCFEDMGVHVSACRIAYNFIYTSIGGVRNPSTVFPLVEGVESLLFQYICSPEPSTEICRSVKSIITSDASNDYDRDLMLAVYDEIFRLGLQEADTIEEAYDNLFSSHPFFGQHPDEIKFYTNINFCFKYLSLLPGNADVWFRVHEYIWELTNLSLDDIGFNIFPLNNVSNSIKCFRFPLVEVNKHVLCGTLTSHAEEVILTTKRALSDSGMAYFRQQCMAWRQDSCDSMKATCTCNESLLACAERRPRFVSCLDGFSADKVGEKDAYESALVGNAMVFAKLNALVTALDRVISILSDIMCAPSNNLRNEEVNSLGMDYYSSKFVSVFEMQCITLLTILKLLDRDTDEYKSTLEKAYYASWRGIDILVSSTKPSKNKLFDFQNVVGSANMDYDVCKDLPELQTNDFESMSSGYFLYFVRGKCLWKLTRNASQALPYLAHADCLATNLISADKIDRRHRAVIIGEIHKVRLHAARKILSTHPYIPPSEEVLGVLQRTYGAIGQMSDGRLSNDALNTMNSPVYAVGSSTSIVVCQDCGHPLCVGGDGVDNMLAHDERLWHVIEDALRGLETCRQLNPYDFHSVFVKSDFLNSLRYFQIPSVVTWNVGGHNEQQHCSAPTDILSTCIKEMYKLFDKRRTQIVAMWTHKNSPVRFDQFLERIINFDSLRYKYICHYWQLLFSARDILKVRDLMTAVLSCYSKQSFRGAVRWLTMTSALVLIQLFAGCFRDTIASVSSNCEKHESAEELMRQYFFSVEGVVTGAKVNQPKIQKCCARLLVEMHIFMVSPEEYATSGSSIDPDEWDVESRLDSAMEWCVQRGWVSGNNAISKRIRARKSTSSHRRASSAALTLCCDENIREGDQCSRNAGGPTSFPLMSTADERMLDKRYAKRNSKVSNDGLFKAKAINAVRNKLSFLNYRGVGAEEREEVGVLSDILTYERPEDEHSAYGIDVDRSRKKRAIDSVQRRFSCFGIVNQPNRYFEAFDDEFLHIDSESAAVNASDGSVCYESSAKAFKRKSIERVAQVFSVMSKSGDELHYVPSKSRKNSSDALIPLCVPAAVELTPVVSRMPVASLKRRALDSVKNRFS